MATTLSQARALLRRMLREPTANQWSDARLNELIQQSDWAEFIALQKIRNSGFGQIQEEITLAADATTFSLTTGTPPTGLTYNLEAILFVEHQGTSGFWNLCRVLQEGDEYSLRAVNATIATGDVPPYYRLRRPNIVFLPAASAARTLRVTYRPLPTALSADGTNLNCPDVLVQLVTTRAASFAMADLGEEETQFDSAYGVLKDEAFRMYDNVNAEGRSLTMKLVESPGMFF